MAPQALACPDCGRSLFFVSKDQATACPLYWFTCKSCGRAFVESPFGHILVKLEDYVEAREAL